MSDTYFLSRGAHKTADRGRCAMEWVALLAGEAHSDTPVCVSPVLTRFCISFNDALDDEMRQRLRPYLARAIGTRGDGFDEQRAWLATDWLVRVYTPTWLAAAGLDDHAERLRSLPPVLVVENLDRAMPQLDAARNAAWAAARAAAWDAAWDAAGNAAWDAAWAAAGAAARDAARNVARNAAWAAAGAAARDAARNVAWDAAWAAGGAAARNALVPTVAALHESAFGLLDSMLPTELIQVPVVSEWREVCAIA